MTSADILRAARARIADPKNWTTNHFAKTRSGMHVFGDSPYAVCWCAIGALQAEGKGYCTAEGDLLHSASRELFGSDPEWINDNGDHPAVLRIYDRAIELAEGK